MKYPHQQQSYPAKIIVDNQCVAWHTHERECRFAHGDTEWWRKNKRNWASQLNLIYSDRHQIGMTCGYMKLWQKERHLREENACSSQVVLILWFIQLTHRRSFCSRISRRSQKIENRCCFLSYLRCCNTLGHSMWWRPETEREHLPVFTLTGMNSHVCWDGPLTLANLSEEHLRW